ncbi:MAG: glycosyltransferase [Bacteroidia bacterium]
MFFEKFTPVELSFLSVLAVALLAQTHYFFRIFGKLAFLKPRPSGKNELEPLTVIIAARNESKNIKKNLHSVLEQDYPDFEVIVVNDCSWDDSQKVLEEMQKEFPHLKVSQLIEQEKYPTGKKFALTIGIKAAKNDLLVFTDADCVPASRNWLRHMQSRMTGNKEIVLGFSPYEKQSGFLNLFIRFETLMTALFYLGMALKKNPFMGVGRNLAYRKELFFRQKGFANHQHIRSGDDDLFVNEAANSSNTAIEIHPESFVYTEAKKDFGSWSSQKKRHMTTGKYYKNKHRNVLGIYYASMMLFYILTAAILVLNIQLWYFVAGIYFLRLVSQEIVFYYAAKKLNCLNVLAALPLLDLLYVFYLAVYGTIGLLTFKRKKW